MDVSKPALLLCKADALGEIDIQSSMRFDVLELPRTYVKNSIHLALSNNMLFEEVR